MLGLVWLKLKKKVKEISLDLRKKVLLEVERESNSTTKLSKVGREDFGRLRKENYSRVNLKKISTKLSPLATELRMYFCLEGKK